MNQCIYPPVYNMAGKQEPVANPAIYFYIPNIIGYVRVILMFVSFHYALTDWKIFTAAYAVSYLLDALDGTAARYFNQNSDFGAVLDMITDRSSTLGLLVILSHIYPHLLFAVCSVCALDISSHYAQMYSSMRSGSTSHKKLSKDRSWILRQYYENRVVLFWVCFGQEAFLLGLYFRHYWTGAVLTVLQGFAITYIDAWILVWAPIFFLKQGISVVQLGGAMDQLTYKTAQA